MPAIFDVEHYLNLKPGPGTGPGRFLAMMFAMSIRDQATRWVLGPDPKNPSWSAESCYFISGVKHVLVPPPSASARCVARFFKQLVGGGGALALQLGERQLVVHAHIEPREVTDQITVELPISSALHGPAARLLDRCTTKGDEQLMEFEDTEFEDDTKQRGPRARFQICGNINRWGDWRLFLGRRRMPFHADMHAPTKFLMMLLLMGFRDRARRLEIRPNGDEVSAGYFVDKWYDFVSPPAFVWPQLVRVIERHAVLIRPESGDLDAPAVGWLELRWGQDLPPDHLAVFLDPRKDSSQLWIDFMRVAPEKTEAPVAAETPADEDDTGDEMTVEFSPDDQ
ncbi:hypothetical protein [Gemmata sp.]|uniref:hypothetical protein n=1 Tax=Gemmata sp. TaxID=1914242 RepID=UPI003F72DBDD